MQNNQKTMTDENKESVEQRDEKKPSVWATILKIYLVGAATSFALMLMVNIIETVGYINKAGMSWSEAGIFFNDIFASFMFAIFWPLTILLFIGAGGANFSW